MSIRTTPPPAIPPPTATGLAPGRLGTLGISGIVISALALLTTVAAALPAALAVNGGRSGLPIAFASVGAILLIFAVGYTAMSRRIPHAGALYAYVTHGMGRPLGLAAAFLALVSYLAFLGAAYGGVAAATVSIASPDGGGLPWWGWALGAWLIATVLGTRQIQVAGWILGGLAVIEALIVLVLLIAWLTHPATGHLTLAGWSPTELTTPAVMVLAVTAYTGFETSATYGEEAITARTVGRATYLTLGVATVVYAVAVYALAAAGDPTWIAVYATDHGAATAFDLARQAGLPGVVAEAGQVVFPACVLAALLAFTSAVTRYIFALGREGILPSALGRTRPRTGAPLAAALTVQTIALIVIAVAAITGADPLLQLFYIGGAVGGLGILVLLDATTVAILFYFRRHRDGESTWATIVCPFLAACALFTVLQYTVRGFGDLIGVPDTDPLRWALPAGLGAVAVIGFAWAVILARTRPGLYRRIGLGPDADRVPAPTDVAHHTDADRTTDTAGGDRQW